MTDPMPWGEGGFSDGLSDLLELPDSSACSGGESAATDEEWKKDSKAWLERARVKTAQSSRRSRMKRKQKEETLYEENKRLKKERAVCLEKIASLEESIRVERSLSGRPISLDLENELLRVQLQEHREFMDKYLTMVQGVSELDKAKHKAWEAVSKDEIDNAESMLNSLVSDSSQWKPVSFSSRKYKFQNAKVKKNLTACYKILPPIDDTPQNTTGGRRMHVRFDAVFPGVSAKKIANFYWKTYVEKEAFKHFFKHPETVQMKYDFDIIPIEVYVSANDKEDKKDENGKDKVIPIPEYVHGKEQMIGFVYHEYRPERSDVMAHHICSTRSVEVAKSTLLLPRKLSPRIAQHGSHKRPKNGVFGNTEAVVMCRTKSQSKTFKEMENELNAAVDSNMRMDGAVIWEEENIIDKETVKCGRWVAVIEILEGKVGSQIIETFNSFVNFKGELNERICAALDRLFAALYAPEEELRLALAASRKQ